MSPKLLGLLVQIHHQPAYGPNSAFNYTVLSQMRNTELLAAIDSIDSFDEATRKAALMAGKNMRLKKLCDPNVV